MRAYASQVQASIKQWLGIASKPKLTLTAQCVDKASELLNLSLVGGVK